MWGWWWLRLGLARWPLAVAAYGGCWAAYLTASAPGTPEALSFPVIVGIPVLVQLRRFEKAVRPAGRLGRRELRALQRAWARATLPDEPRLARAALLSLRQRPAPSRRRWALAVGAGAPALGLLAAVAAGRRDHASLALIAEALLLMAAVATASAFELPRVLAVRAQARARGLTSPP